MAVVIGLAVVNLWAMGMLGHEPPSTEREIVLEPQRNWPTAPYPHASASPSVGFSPGRKPARATSGPFEGRLATTAVKDGDTYLCGDIRIQILEFNPDASEQVKEIEAEKSGSGAKASIKSRDYAAVKVRMSKTRVEEFEAKNYKFHLIDDEVQELNGKGENETKNLENRVDELRNDWFSDMWIYFRTYKPFVKGKLYVEFYGLSEDPVSAAKSRIFCRIDAPVGG